MRNTHSLVDSSAAVGSQADALTPPVPHGLPPRRVARLCSLEYALGRQVPCTADACPFWEPGGAVLEPGCMLERFLAPEDWPPDLAARWLRVRLLAEQQRRI